jgi:hypothetical protein
MKGRVLPPVTGDHRGVYTEIIQPDLGRVQFIFEYQTWMSSGGACLLTRGHDEDDRDDNPYKDTFAHEGLVLCFNINLFNLYITKKIPGYHTRDTKPSLTLKN